MRRTHRLSHLITPHVFLTQIVGEEKEEKEEEEEEEEEEGDLLDLSRVVWPSGHDDV